MNNGEQIKSCRLDTGDRVGAAWGNSPEWTPYAQAIADHYPIQLPWFVTTLVTFTAPPPSLVLPRTIVTKPQQYDVLIHGFSATAETAAAGTPAAAYLQVTHQESGIPWVAPNQFGYAPLAAFAGINLNPTPILKLPEAFFLPARTLLKLQWVMPAGLPGNQTLTIRLTMVGVQLINPKLGFKAPGKITMPNGDEIPVGSRLPWFGCIPFGARPNLAGSRIFGDFELDQNSQTVQYLPPVDCNVELHDCYASFLDSTFEFDPGLGDTTRLQTKLNDTRSRNSWTPTFTPVQAVFGSRTQVYPAMPFPIPRLMKTDHRTAMAAQNNNSAALTEVLRGTVTFRGVKLCEY